MPVTVMEQASIPQPLPEHHHQYHHNHQQSRSRSSTYSAHDAAGDSQTGAFITPWPVDEPYYEPPPPQQPPAAPPEDGLETAGNEASALYEMLTPSLPSPT